MRYSIVVEKTDSGFSACSPDLDGCIATGDTQEDVEKLMKESIEFHLDEMREEGLNIPEPRTYSRYVEVV